jgi:hypothetical protein
MDVVLVCAVVDVKSIANLDVCYCMANYADNIAIKFDFVANTVRINIINNSGHLRVITRCKIDDIIHKIKKLNT